MLATDIADLLQTTMRKLPDLKFVQVAQDLHDYEVMGKWLKEDKLIEEGGVGIEERLMITLPTTAQHTGEFEDDTLVITDLLTTLRVDWAHCQNHYAFSHGEVIRNKGKAMILKLLQPREVATLLDTAGDLEQKGWRAPSTAETREPYGVPYWIVKNATQGFNGGNPTGHDATAYTTCGGIDASAVANWRNYTDTFTNYTAADYLEKLRRAHNKCKWRSPVTEKGAYKLMTERRRHYLSYDNLAEVRKIAEARNDDLGFDLEAHATTFHNYPFVEIEELEADTDNPTYMIDHQTFRCHVLQGDYLRRTGPDRLVGKQHNTFVVWIDLTYLFCCINRRANAVIYQV